MCASHCATRANSKVLLDLGVGNLPIGEDNVVKDNVKAHLLSLCSENVVRVPLLDEL